MTKRMMKNRIMKLKDLEAQKAILEKEMDSLKEQIKTEMDLQHTEEMLIDDYIVRYTSMVSNRFNSKAFQTDHPGMYKKYIQASTSRRFSIV